MNVERNKKRMLYRLVLWVYNFGPTLWLLPCIIYICILTFFAVQNDIFTTGWKDQNHKKPVPPNLLEGSERYSSKNLSDGITFVTAYFNLGTFRKGAHKTFSVDTYYSWMKNYAYVNNTVILYTDMEDLAVKFKLKRSSLPDHMTVTFVIKQEDFWGFQLKGAIKSVFKQPGYPQYFPNTVFELYPCAMHVKYDVIEKVIKEGLSKTKYLAWLDIGYFRYKETEVFTLQPPDNIKDDHISFLQINAFYSYTPRQIIYDNLVWVAGGMFIGRPEYLLLLVEDYRSTVRALLDLKLMSTDQQVIYSLYTPESPFKPRVPIQTYHSNNRDMWFFLGDICREKDALKTRTNKKMTELVTTYFYC